MKNARVTKSIDTLNIEVYEKEGVEYVDVCHSGLTGNRFPGLNFEKGDKKAALELMSHISTLLGLGAIGFKKT